MRRIALLLMTLMVLAFIAGCNPSQTDNTDDSTVSDKISNCDRMSEGGRKIMCYAVEAKKIKMCDAVVGRFRDDCVVTLAEMTDGDESNCEMAESETNKKLCRALITRNVEKCFDWGPGVGIAGGLAVRDCIDLVARKLKDPDLCDLHESRAQQIYTICGQTQNCEGEAITGAVDNKENCVINLQA